MARIGSISTGTLRPQDLINSFADELERLDRDRVYMRLISEARRPTSHPNEVLSDLEEALSGFAPPYCFFGGHPGDGADFGYWPDWVSIAEARNTGELPSGDTLPEHPSPGGYYLHISDHGNAELYGWDSTGKSWRSLWSVV